MRYKVLLHRTDEGVSVSVPGLPGCWSEGDTEEECSRTSVTPSASMWPPSRTRLGVRMSVKSRSRFRVRD